LLVLAAGCSGEKEAAQTEQPEMMVMEQPEAEVVEPEVQEVLVETTEDVQEPLQPDVKYQSKCPAMGGPIDKSLYVDFDQFRIYVCCPACVEKVKEDPQIYYDIIMGQGETVVKISEAAAFEKAALPQDVVIAPEDAAKKAEEMAGEPVLCPKCGEVKGSSACCNFEGKELCPKCGLIKGSPGGCKVNNTTTPKM